MSEHWLEVHLPYKEGLELAACALGQIEVGALTTAHWGAQPSTTFGSRDGAGLGAATDREGVVADHRARRQKGDVWTGCASCPWDRTSSGWD